MFILPTGNLRFPTKNNEGLTPDEVMEFIPHIQRTAKIARLLYSKPEQELVEPELPRPEPTKKPRDETRRVPRIKCN